MADSNITCSSLAVAGGLGVHVLAWAFSAATVPGAPYPLPYLDLDHFEVWSAATNDRAGATLAAEPRDTKLTVSGLAYSTTRYYWVRAVDKSSNVGDWWPVSATGGVSGTTLDKFTGSDLLPNSVPGSVLQVSTISARELVLADFSNMIGDPGFANFANTWADVVGVNFGSASSFGSNVQGGRFLRVPAGISRAGSDLVFACRSQIFPVIPGQEYAYGATLGLGTGGTGSLRADIVWLDSAGAIISGSAQLTRSTVGGLAYNEIATAPATAANAYFRLLRYAASVGAATVGTADYYNLYMRKAQNASLIVDGAITAAKVTAGTVVADLLVVSSLIVTGHITNNAITNIYSGGTDTQITANNSTTYKTIVTVANVVVPTGASAQLTFSSSGENGNVCTNQFQILRDATVVATFYGSMINAGGSGSVAYRYQSSYVLLDSPSAGTYDYVVQVRSLASGGATSEQSNWRYNRGVVSLYKK